MWLVVSHNGPIILKIFQCHDVFMYPVFAKQSSPAYFAVFTYTYWNGLEQIWEDMCHSPMASRAIINTTSQFNSLGSSDAIWWQKSGSTLTQVMACCLTAPSHYLNQCWLIISKVEWHSSKGKFTRGTSDINPCNYPENEVPKISFKFPRGQWVNSSRLSELIIQPTAVIRWSKIIWYCTVATDAKH